MKYVYLTLNWVFGVLIGLSGLLLLIEGPLAGICLIAIALLLLPPVRSAVFAKTNKEFPFKAKAISIFVLFIAFGIFARQSDQRIAAELEVQKAEEQEQAQKITKARQDNIDYFSSHKEEILASASSAISEKNYQVVVNQTSKYLPSNDDDLNEIYGKAKSALDEIKKAEKEAKDKLQRESKTKELVAKLKTVSGSKFAENKNLYQQLVKLNPDNTTYQQKLDFYSQKLSEKIEKEKREQERLKKEREARVAKFGEAPTKSSWDGSYYAVERYLKRVANDPDSIDIDGCTEVYHTESGWLVGCDYRGRNAFGGMIRQSNWFTIVHDQVIQMHDASAYKQ